MLKLCKPDIHLFVGAFFCLCVAAIGQAYIPTLTGDIVDLESQGSNSMEKGDDAFINTLHELLEPEISSETAFEAEIKINQRMHKRNRSDKQEKEYCNGSVFGASDKIPFAGSYTVDRCRQDID